MNSHPLVARLRELLGENAVLTARTDLAGYRNDSVLRRDDGIVCVARPANAGEVARLLAACNDARVPVVTRGGGTGFAGGALPVPGEQALVLSLERMRCIRSLDAIGNVLVAEAGCTLHEARQAAEAAGRALGLDHGGAGSSTVGGNLATNAGGINVVRYGMARDQVLAVEAVLADGTLLGLPAALPKSNAGYDFRHLLIGSEGTLAVITAAAFRLRNAVVARATAMLGLSSPEQAVALFAFARETLGDAIAAFELLSRSGLEFHFAHAGAAREPLGGRPPWLVLLECEAASRHFDLDGALQAMLERAAQQGLITDAGIAVSLAQRRAFWALREGIALAMGEARVCIAKTDTAVPIARVPEFIARTAALAVERAPGGTPVAFGHVGDGNIHFNVLPPAGMNDDDFRTIARGIEAAVGDVALELGGTVSAEHGIGQLKREALRRMRGAREIDLMRGVKRVFDPLATLNPGKIFEP